MLSHPVSLHIPRRHVLLVLPALDLSLLLLPLGGSLPPYPYPVRRLRLIPCRLAGEEDHADFLTDIISQAQPIKQADQSIKFILDPEGARR